MSRSRTLALLVALAAPFIAACATGCHKSSQAQESQGPNAPPGEAWLTPQQAKDIEYAPVDDQNVDDTILTSGKVTFDDQKVSHIYSPVSGRVTRIDTVLGAHVKKGQQLAFLDSPDIGIASSDVRKAQADLIAAEHDFKRTKDLFDAHAASQKDLEISEDNYRKAKAELGRAVEKARLLHAGGGGDNVVQGYPVIAPMEGEVIMKNVSPGIEVQGQYGGGTAQELFTVGELDKVWVIADVFEMDIARVKVGSKAVVKVVAYSGKNFEGKVDWVSGTLDPVTRTAKVRCTFDNPDHLLKPEMYATVQVSVEERQALAIPRSALLRLGEQTVVFVFVGNAPDGRLKFERIPVTVDEGEGGKWVPVTHGLEKGMKVVTSGAILLSGMI
jgi:cobalt-zinc-cadmium efflux system membrane fusion protein